MRFLITTDEDVYIVNAESSTNAVLDVLHYCGDDYSVVKKSSKFLELSDFIELVNHYTNGYNILSVSQTEIVTLYGDRYGAALTKIGH